MTSFLFSQWLMHFIKSVHVIDNISIEERHLLILDGHASHITLDVLLQAQESSLDIVTLPSHMSHALQPLDVLVFRPFKQVFHSYMDAWIEQHSRRIVSNEQLAQWVSLLICWAFTPTNIMAGFKATRIFPFNDHAMDKRLKLHSSFLKAERESNGLVAEKMEEDHLSQGANTPTPEVRHQQSTLPSGNSVCMIARILFF